jgi:hypothetical protein
MEMTLDNAKSITKRRDKRSHFLIRVNLISILSREMYIVIKKIGRKLIKYLEATKCGIFRIVQNK